MSQIFLLISYPPFVFFNLFLICSKCILSYTIKYRLHNKIPIQFPFYNIWILPTSCIWDYIYTNFRSTTRLLWEMNPKLPTKEAYPNSALIDLALVFWTYSACWKFEWAANYKTKWNPYKWIALVKIHLIKPVSCICALDLIAERQKDQLGNFAVRSISWFYVTLLRWMEETFQIVCGEVTRERSELSRTIRINLFVVTMA